MCPYIQPGLPLSSGCAILQTSPIIVMTSCLIIDTVHQRIFILHDTSGNSVQYLSKLVHRGELDRKLRSQGVCHGWMAFSLPSRSEKWKENKG